MDYHTALAKAARLRDHLAPHCERIVIAGSIRRQKPEPKDIELVAIPFQAPVDLFGDENGHCPAFGEALQQVGRIVQGCPVHGKGIKLVLHDGTAVDLFTCTRENWGYILTLRTGSAEHNVKLVQRLKANGYECRDGRILWKGAPRETPDEASVFKMAGLAYVEPQHRAA